MKLLKSILKIAAAGVFVVALSGLAGCRDDDRRISYERSGRFESYRGSPGGWEGSSHGNWDRGGSSRSEHHHR